MKAHTAETKAIIAPEKALEIDNCISAELSLTKGWIQISLVDFFSRFKLTQIRLL